MTHDSGLAPNPFFGICSLAVCTPNHMNANLKPGDWVLGHTSSVSAWRLVYVMRLTKVLDMPTYFKEFPQKKPKIDGRLEQQCGDNLYDYREGRWTRVPSVQHNNHDAFKQDHNRKVYLAEGENNFWYFGANNASSFVFEFADRFPGLVKDRQGFSYIYDEAVIQQFVEWLSKNTGPGLRGTPRDSVPESNDKYLTQIEPTEVWIPHAELHSSQASPAPSRLAASSRSGRRGCS